MKKIALALGIIISMTLLLAGCGSEKSQNASAGTTVPGKTDPAKKPAVDRVKIGYVDSGKSFPGDALGIAAEKGFITGELDKIGVKADFIPFVGAGPAINEALGSKDLDIGVYGDTPAILGKGSGIDTTLIAGGNTALDAAIIVPPDSAVKTVKDLKGKKVATMKGSYMHRTLVEILKANGLSVKDIEFFHMKSAEAEAALISKRVDAIVAPNTTYARFVISKKGNFLINCKDHSEWKGMNLSLARTAFAKENPEVITAFIKGLIAAKKFAEANPEETKNIWTKVGFSKEIFDYLYPDNKFGLEIEVKKEIIDTLNYEKGFLKENQLLKGDVDIEKWVDKSYYEKAIK